MSRPRIRSIKPEMFADEAFGTLSPHARLLFIGFITMADDEGRLRALPSAIVGHVFPYDDVPLRKLRTWVSELVRAKLVVIYESAGIPYAWLPGWAKHQRINRPSKSSLPSPPAHGGLTDVSVSDHGELMEDSLPPTRGRAGGSDRIGSEGNPLTPKGKLPTVAPSPPNGNRQRDVSAYRSELNEWVQAHFPGCNDSAIESVIGWVRSRGEDPTPSAVRSFASSAPNFAAALEPAA